MLFKLHTIDTTENLANKELQKTFDQLGYIPNLHAVLAESPQLLTAYKFLHEQFQKTSFSSNELTVVWQSINFENECSYCLPAHTAIAHMMGVSESLIDDLKKGKKLSDPKLERLRLTTRALINKRGRLSKEDMYQFESAGYGTKQLLEILLGISQKTISNYTNHLARTPLDEYFKKYT